MNTDPLFVPEKLYRRRRAINACLAVQEEGGMISPSIHIISHLLKGTYRVRAGYGPEKNISDFKSACYRKSYLVYNVR